MILSRVAFLLLRITYFMLPSYVANSVPIFAKRLKFLNMPLDFNKKLFGQRIFGENKTIRGFFFGIPAGMLVSNVQLHLYQLLFFRDLSLIDYSSINIHRFGFLISAGTLIGDLIKSFFKRRLKIKPGESWKPFDGIDFTLGVVLFTFNYLKPSLIMIFTLLLWNYTIHEFFEKVYFILRKRTKIFLS